MTVKVNPVLMGVVEGADEAPSWDASAARKKNATPYAKTVIERQAVKLNSHPFPPFLLYLLPSFCATGVYDSS